MIKWTEQDVIDFADKVISGTPQAGSNQVLQQLLAKSRQTTSREPQPLRQPQPPREPQPIRQPQAPRQPVRR
jgi:hypothetical protein